MSSKVIRSEQCPICLDTGQDNRKVYDDNSYHCFSCGDNSKKNKQKNSLFLEGTIQSLRTRGITYETCKFFDYLVGQDRQGNWVQLAQYKDSKNNITAQKVRYATNKETGKKSFTILGKGTDLPLYGQWLWSPNPKLFITVVEGELDALSVAQVQGYQYPVVSLPTGATSAKNALKANLKYLLGFKYVILAFDNDEAGLKAFNECATLFEPGMVRQASWALKDANEMLLEGRFQEIKDCIFRAKVFAPDAIVGVVDILDRVLIQPQYGSPYPWKTLTDITYGYQSNEITIIVGANGVGKTEYIKELIFHFMKTETGVGLFSFEQTPESTIRRLVGSKLGLKLHLPGTKWDVELIRTIALELNDRIWLYDKPGSADDAELIHSIRYLAKAKGVKVFIIDNLKGLGGNKDLERMENMMRKFQSMKQELNISFFLLSHVAKDKLQRQVYVSTSRIYDDRTPQTKEQIEGMIMKPGMEWESGRMPTKENVEGASAICDLADYVFALARNTTSSDPNEWRTTRIKCLKARLDGSKAGQEFKLYYTDLGRLEEISINQTISPSNGVF